MVLVCEARKRLDAAASGPEGLSVSLLRVYGLASRPEVLSLASGRQDGPVTPRDGGTPGMAWRP